MSVGTTVASEMKCGLVSRPSSGLSGSSLGVLRGGIRGVGTVRERLDSARPSEGWCGKEPSWVRRVRVVL